MGRTTPLLPLEVRRALRDLGRDIRNARRRRRLPAAIVAARAYISRPTLQRIERGDAAVSLGGYATVLSVLGMGQRIGQLAATQSDSVGLDLQDERLPERIVLARRPRRSREEKLNRGTE